MNGEVTKKKKIDLSGEYGYPDQQESSAIAEDSANKEGTIVQELQDCWNFVSSRLAATFHIVPVLFDSHHFRLLRLDDDFAGELDSLSGIITIDPYEVPSEGEARKRYLLSIVAHEAWHFYSQRKVLQVEGHERKGLRVGIKLIINDAFMGLVFLNEAVTEQMTQQYILDEKKSPHFVYTDGAIYPGSRFLTHQLCSVIATALNDFSQGMYPPWLKKQFAAYSHRLKGMKSLHLLDRQGRSFYSAKDIWEILARITIDPDVPIGDFAYLVNFAYGQGAFQSLVWLSTYVNGDYVPEMSASPSEDELRLWDFITEPQKTRAFNRTNVPPTVQLRLEEVAEKPIEKTTDIDDIPPHVPLLSYPTIRGGEIVGARDLSWNWDYAFRNAAEVSEIEQSIDLYLDIAEGIRSGKSVEDTRAFIAVISETGEETKEEWEILLLAQMLNISLQYPSQVYGLSGDTRESITISVFQPNIPESNKRKLAKVEYVRSSWDGSILQSETFYVAVK